MASRSNSRSQNTGESDSLEVLKPLLVLGLFGTILYGAYSVVQKGPASGPPPAEAPPIAAPAVEFAALPVAPPAEAGFAPPAMPPAQPAGPAAVPPSAAPVAADTAATFLPAESAPPPVAEPAAAEPTGEAARPDRYAALPTGQLPPGLLPGGTATEPAPVVTADPTLPLAPSAAFATAWSDAHDKLGGGHYAEALAALSVWHDDPALGLEESQRLEDLLGQLAGTVIYSQYDLLLPPHVVVAGDTLQSIAAPLAVSWQLLAKINGIDDPQRLYPGEHIKLVRGPFDATVSVSRRRLSLQVGGNYAGSFPVVVGRHYLERVGSSLPIIEIRREPAVQTVGAPAAGRMIVLGEGMTIEAAEDPAALADDAPSMSLIVSTRDLEDLIDILGPASRIRIKD